MAHIFLVDDDELDLRHVERMLSRINMGMPLRVTSIANGALVVKAALADPPDIVLLDMNIGAYLGEVLVTELRTAGIDAAIVLLTGMSDPERVAAGMSAGATKYVRKEQLDEERLAATLSEAMRVTRAERKAAEVTQALARRTVQLEQVVDIGVQIAAQNCHGAITQTAATGASETFKASSSVTIRVAGVVHTANADGDGLSSAHARATKVEHRSGTVQVAMTIQRELEKDEALLASELLRMALATSTNLALVNEAQASARDRHEIVAIVSHDLRTPLQNLSLGIDTINATLESGRDPAALAATTDRMRRSVSSMTRLIDDLLDVSRIHDRALSIRTAPAELQEIVREVSEQFQALANNADLAIRVSDTTTPILAMCDAQRISQALGNLVSNAVRHTQRGTITLRAFRKASIAVLEVEDTGPGIAREVRGQLFDRLYQGNVDDGTTGSMGLGLYVVRGIADAHGGRAGVRSELGVGSTFFLEIPCLLDTEK